MSLLPRPFVLIRHGQTDANRDGRIAGRLEALLTAQGRAAAEALAARSWPADLQLFASPQQRARETAQLAFPGVTPVLHPGLRERDWGIHEGRPVAEQPPRLSTPEGGEAWPDFVQRVAAALTACQEAAGDRLPVIVAHSGVIRVCRFLVFGEAGGPSPANTTPFLYRPLADGWRESVF